MLILILVLFRFLVLKEAWILINFSKEKKKRSEEF